MFRRVLVFAVVLVSALAVAASPASAHNSLSTSTPADGDRLEQPPERIELVFAKPVPLDTLTVTLTHPDGRRETLADIRHSGSEETIMAAVPALAAGDYSVRWRLVGPDGHAVTGRVRFTVTIVEPAAAPVSSLPTSSAPSTRSDTPVAAPLESAGAGSGWNTPGWMRWLLRYSAYLAVMTVAGIAVAEAVVWRRPAPKRLADVVSAALGVVTVTALLQLLVLAGDIAGKAPWNPWSALGTAVDHPVGMALVIRVYIAFAAWVLVVRQRPNSPDVYGQMIVLLAMAMLATWSFTGHARSMRWPWLGVPVDVVHHGAAAAWIGGLGVLGFHTLRRHHSSVGEAMTRFGRVAAWSVGLIVATGVVQALRLTGGVGAVTGSTHGRLLLAKVALLAFMLVLADRNRRAVQRRFEPGVANAGDVASMRAMVRRELVMGVAIIGVTASLVVSPPAVASDAGSGERPAVVSSE